MTSTSFAITLPHGRPIPQPRPRAMSMGKAARVYNPTSFELDAYKLAIRDAIPPELHGRNHTGPVGLVIRMMYERPQSHLNAKGEVKGETYASPAPIAPMAQNDGDFDNLAKVIADVMQACGVYANDSQITDPVGPIKRYAPPGMPGVVWVIVHLWDSLPDEWLGFPKYLEVSNA